MATRGARYNLKVFADLLDSYSRYEAVHMQANHLELYALGELPADISGIIESHLESCVDCGIQFEESRATIGMWSEELEKPEYKGPEHRKSPRLETDDPAVLTLIRPERPSRVGIRILDASREGLKLSTPCELETGSFVQVHVRELFILAEVRYCIPAAEGFYAGVQIYDVFPACG